MDYLPESAVSNFYLMLEQNARLIATVGTLSALSLVVVPLLGQSYRAYIGAGRSGLPPNVYGWANSTLLKVFLRTRRPAPAGLQTL